MAVIFGLLILAPGSTFGQVTSTTTTVSSTGTVSEFTPNAIAVKVDTSPTPVRYRFSKTTTYVDENGNPVSIETVKTGVPVKVYYEKEGDTNLADKVVVEKSIATTAPAVTTTTVATPPNTPPSMNGVVTDAGEGHIDLRTAESPRPIHYKAHDSTAYVDENGNPVSRKILTPGTPATVFYEQSGDHLWATRVVVRNSALLDR